MEVTGSKEVQGSGRSEEAQQDGSEFPFCFDREGRLLHRDTQEPFLFRWRRGEGAGRSAAELEALGRCISQHVSHLLEEQCRLRRVPLPLPSRGRVWVGGGSGGTLLVLLQDRGVVRSGQWSWQAIVRDGLQAGSQLPYVRQALREGWGVALLDPNEGGASPEEHLRLAWDSLLAGGGAGQVAVVTHGYGGLALVDLLGRRPQELQRRVRAVAFIDSAHNLWHQPLGGAARDWLKAHSRKWVLSSKPLNRPVGSLKVDVPQLSAGTLSPGHAPAACMDAVFRYIAKTLRAEPLLSPIITRSKSQGRSRGPGGGARPHHAHASRT